MTLKECYELLGVMQNASLEEVKRGYRKRAFEWHPDLNPQLKDAGQRFQRLNEAYVILTKLLQARDTRDERVRKEREAKAAYTKTRSQEQTKTSQQTTKQNTKQATQQTDEKAQQKTTKSTTDTGKTESQTKKPEAETKTKTESAGKAEQSQSATSQKTDSKAAGTAGAQTRQTAGENVYTEQQEVLKDILNDPFARRVFEDIYSAIRQKGQAPPKVEPVPKSAPNQNSGTSLGNIFGFGSRKAKQPAEPKPAAEKTETFWDSLFAKAPSHDSKTGQKGVGHAMKDWLRGQIDDAQTVYFPASKLFPGARLRLQIRRGLSDELTVLDVVLPADFAVGKAIRLRGMGKKLGKMQGDMYLTLLVKE